MACCKESGELSALLGCKIGIYELFLLKFSDMDFFENEKDGWLGGSKMFNQCHKI